MTFARPGDLPNIGLGLAAVTLGALGLAMFFLPVLGIPIALAGLAAGVAGAVIAAVWKAYDLRLALTGIGLSVLAAAIGWAMTYAPSGFLAPSEIGPRFRSVPAVRTGKPPPPARFRGAAQSSQRVSATPHI
jgi:hypothetical protein